MPAQEEDRSQPQSSRIGTTSKLKGEWVCDEDVILEGQFEGKIDSRDHGLRIEKMAIVKADIHGKKIIVHGNVTGNITASGKILVEKDARIIGDLEAPQIAIQEGARFKGTVKMTPAKSS